MRLMTGPLSRRQNGRKRKTGATILQEDETLSVDEAAAVIASNGEAEKEPRAAFRSGTIRTARRRLSSLLQATSPVPVYLGLVIVGIGFGTIAFTWGRVATLTSVPLQLPYLVSGGVAGLGLVMAGITIISVATKRRAAARQARQMERVAKLLDEIRAVLLEDSDNK